jgi:hypothetical protein
MSATSRVKAQTAGELLQHFELSDESESVAAIEDAPMKAIKKLLDSESYHDAVTMLAHALPKREAVWWGCLAAKKAMDPAVELNVAAVSAAELWVRDPSENNRQAAKKLGELAKNKTAAGWSATAASWCTGNMVEGDEIAVPPPDCLYAHAVAACITMAAVEAGPENMSASYQLFVRQGFDLAGGGSGQVE